MALSMLVRWVRELEPSPRVDTICLVTMVLQFSPEIPFCSPEPLNVRAR